MLLSGAWQLSCKGGEAVTVDVDLAFDRSIQNIERLADALEELGAKPKRWLTKSYRLRLSDLGTKWLHLESDAGDIYLIADVPGLPYRSIKEKSKAIDLDATILPIASVKDLIEMKRNTGRGKDAIHVAELENLLKIIYEGDPKTD